ncbi:MAG: hypothetical protein RL748_201 [Pseudomonadota bacterium]
MRIKYHAIIAVKPNSAIQGIAGIFRRKFALLKLKVRRTRDAAIRPSQNRAAWLQP